jgi:hypothetical protein
VPALRPHLRAKSEYEEGCGRCDVRRAGGGWARIVCGRGCGRLSQRGSDCQPQDIGAATSLIGSMAMAQAAGEAEADALRLD